MKFTKAFKEEIRNDYKNGKIECVVTYIKEKGISNAAFYRWTKDLRDENVEFIDVTNLIDKSSDVSLKLSLNEVNINIDNHYNEELLLKVIRTLKKI